MKNDIAVVIVAAGRGSRLSDAENAAPKQYRMLGDKCVLQHAINQFAASHLISHIQVVIHADDEQLYQACVAADEKLREPVTGGATRQESSANGVLALADLGVEKVLIHDAARPFVREKTIAGVIAAIGPGVCAVPANPMTDTLKHAVSEKGKAAIATTVPRDNLYTVQTPQGFRYGEIAEAHKNAKKAGINGFSDDAAIAEWAKMQVVLVDGDPANLKITTSRDLELVNQQLHAAQMVPSNSTAHSIPDIRTGNGYDVHRLTSGVGVILCGVKIPSDKKLEGHSDADVAMHAITDALLGTIGKGDIGSHFPPSDPQWKNTSSYHFLSHACALVRKEKGTITHLDVSIICEEPKISQYREAMRVCIAAVCGLEVKRVSVKATTHEKIGALGRGEGIAAIATATAVFAP